MKVEMGRWVVATGALMLLAPAAGCGKTAAAGPPAAAQAVVGEAAEAALAEATPKNEPAAKAEETPKMAPKATPEPVEAAEPASAGEVIPVASGSAPLSPGTIDPEMAVPVADLAAAYFDFKGNTFTVAGHPKTFFAEEALGNKIKLVAAPEDRKKKELLSCRLTEADTTKVKSSDWVVVTGVMNKRSGFGRIELDKCTLVSVGAEAPTLASTVDTGAPTGIYSVQALHDAIYGWDGKKVMVVGDYHSHTKSTTKSDGVEKVSFRMDLTGPGGAKAVGCYLPEAPKAGIEKNRAGVIVRGTIGRAFFKQVGLNDCTVTNR